MEKLSHCIRDLSFILTLSSDTYNLKVHIHEKLISLLSWIVRHLIKTIKMSVFHGGNAIEMAQNRQTQQLGLQQVRFHLISTP